MGKGVQEAVYRSENISTSGALSLPNVLKVPPQCPEIHVLFTTLNNLVLKQENLYIYTTSVLEGWPSWLKAQVC